MFELSKVLFKLDCTLDKLGKGSTTRAYSNSGRNQWWKRIKAKHGIMIELASENLTEDTAFNLEKYLIKIMRESGITLCNLTNGGEGSGHHTPWNKGKHTGQGRKVSAETLENMKAAQQKRFAYEHEHDIKREYKYSSKQFKYQKGKQYRRPHLPRKPVSEETKQKIKDAWAIRKERELSLLPRLC